MGCSNRRSSTAWRAWVKCRASCCERSTQLCRASDQVIFCCWHEVLKRNISGTQSLHSEIHAKRSTKPLPRPGSSQCLANNCISALRPGCLANHCIRAWLDVFRSSVVGVSDLRPRCVKSANLPASELRKWHQVGNWLVAVVCA